jgi:hypothetical protein
MGKMKAGAPGSPAAHARHADPEAPQPPAGRRQLDDVESSVARLFEAITRVMRPA